MLNNKHILADVPWRRVGDLYDQSKNAYEWGAGGACA